MSKQRKESFKEQHTKPFEIILIEMMIKMCFFLCAWVKLSFPKCHDVGIWTYSVLLLVEGRVGEKIPNWGTLT